MHKKDIAIGVALLLAAGAAFWLSSRYAPPAPAQPAITTSSSGSPLARNEAPPPGPAQTAPDAAFSAAPKSNLPAEFITLTNGTITVKFTTAGGAIDTIALDKHKAALGSDEPYALDAAKTDPALAFMGYPGLDKDARYELVSHTADEVVYRIVLDNRLEVTRRYRLLGSAGGDPYQVRQETTFRNLTDQTLPLPRGMANIGTATPLGENDTGVYLFAGQFDGEKAEFTQRDALAGGGFSSKPPLPLLDKTAPVKWASVQNQFFASVLTLDQPGTGIRITRLKTNEIAPDEDRKAYALKSAVLFELQPIAPHGSENWNATLYAGPKEYTRLANSNNFKASEEKVMNFAPYFFNRIFFSGTFAPLLLTIMNWVHKWVPNWGWSIVVMTILLKVVTLPFTFAASRSAKRMQKVMPLINEMREKLKDNPAKQQEAMLRIYKEQKVNPLGGCLPVLITMPFFVGFFAMLQNSSDLRLASFLWVKDLSAPDVVVSFGYTTLPLLGLTHLSINVLPLILGATNFFQTRLTPTPSTDPTQATMMKLMPIMFMLFCYNFAAALSLYSTMNGLLTILQQVIINRLPEPQLATGADGLKNVTPKKKR